MRIRAKMASPKNALYKKITLKTFIMTFSFKKIFLLVTALVLILGGLYGTYRVVAPASSTFHETNPLPDFKNDLSLFMDIGCALENGGSIICPNPSAITSSGCGNFHIPSSSLGGLNPAYPMIECWGWDYSSEENDSVRLSACPSDPFYQYAISLGGYLSFIKNTNDFKTLFAPVETPEEAIGFAIALTGDDPLFDFTLPSDVKFSIDPSDFQLTYAEETDKGYEVLLFSDQGCGCHYLTLLTAKKYLVTSSGDVTLMDSYEIYHGADEGMICVD